MSSAVLANGYPRPTQRRQLLNFRVPEHTIPPLIVEESSELAKMYLGFKDAALEMIGNGMSAKQILGDADEIVLDLFFRPRVATDPYTVCNWACELIRNIPGFDVYMQLAWIALLTRFMRVSFASFNIETQLRIFTRGLLVDHSPHRGQLCQNTSHDETNQSSTAYPSLPSSRSVSAVSKQNWLYVWNN